MGAGIAQRAGLLRSLTATAPFMFHSPKDPSQQAASAAPDTEVVHVPGVGGPILRHVVAFMTAAHAHPGSFRTLERPLRSMFLEDSGVPRWAVELVGAVPGHELLDVADAAQLLRIPMLHALIGAHIASLFMQLGARRIVQHGLCSASSSEEDLDSLLEQAPVFAMDWTTLDPVRDDDGDGDGGFP